MNREALHLYHRLLEIYKEMRNCKTYYYFIRLYLEYLKVIVQLQSKLPSLRRDQFSYACGNCYSYALGYSFPKSFKRILDQVNEGKFNFNLGFIGNRMELLTKNYRQMLDNFYLDCEALQVEVFDTDAYSINQHGGYKVMLFFEREGCDFHFIRQNTNGSWSERYGLNGQIQLVRRFVPPVIKNHYDLVKTLEVVKPRFK